MAAAADLTIVLTLKDRAAFTMRWLEYAERMALPFKVLIADGGRDESVPRALAERSRFPNVDYEYVRYPYDATYADYYAKTSDAISRVRTPYVALADNDDLFIVEGLRKAVEFLAANPDYVACGGQCAAFWVAPGRGTGPDGRLHGPRVEWKFSNNAHSEASRTARERIRNQSLGADDIFYHVIRTPELARQFRIVRDFAPTDLFLVEQLVSYLCAIAGKIRQLDTLYIARQQDSPGSSGGAHQQQYGGWWGRMLVPTWSRDFGEFLRITADELARADGIPPEEARAWIVKSYRLSVAPSLLSDILEEETITPAMPLTTQLVRRLVALPETSLVRRCARAFYRRTRWISFDAVYATEF
ncbi:MAG: TIGR00180 family glycosyltransferase, partial [Usitatibacter sp.]